ncbi:hypothetical protein [Candidatus Tisiphia endosymbiont of Nemotelus uliginosus]|uniref:hypothetical protein n=1 Tax=Candidatus Tisiphia endosymbiont of Nemotelus uliginosus TaxID=3077926 RepID=UPI0035C8A7B6
MPDKDINTTIKTEATTIGQSVKDKAQQFGELGNYKSTPQNKNISVAKGVELYGGGNVHGKTIPGKSPISR